jgi:hypothetical protein
MLHPPEMREVVGPAVTLGPHVVDVDLCPMVQRLVADRTAPVWPPGEWPRATRRAVGALPPWAPGVRAGRVRGSRRGGHESMADDGGPGACPAGPMPCLLLHPPAVLRPAEPAPILLGAPPARGARVTPWPGALSASIQEAVPGRADLLGHAEAARGTPAAADGMHRVHQRHGG